MGAPNNLQAITSKVRLLTARSSPAQMTDAMIHQYINTYYLYDMPESLRLLKLKDIFTFTTAPNQELYPFDNTNYITVEPPAYVAGQQIQYFQDLDLFYREWPKINYFQIIGSGNGTPGPYTGVLSATPFMQSLNTTPSPPPNLIGRDVRVLITANTGIGSATSVIDNGSGGFLDATTGAVLPGTINYLTGAFSVTFSNNVPAQVQINASTIPYVASLPRTICMYQNQFILRPIPDQAYIVEINAFRYPTSLLNNTDVPELAFWWQLLAYGAARKILTDNGDYENAAAQEPLLLEQLAFVQRRTLKQLSTQRASTIYSNDSSYPYSNLYPYI